MIGNPSDGFGGVTIALTFDAFWADVFIWESPEVEFRLAPRDATRYESLTDLVDSVRCYGYYGGIRLIKAIVKVFVDYCRHHDIELPPRNFTLQYQSNIPLRVGLAGSSAIITSTLQALLAFYDVSVPQEELPNLALHAETQELKIGAGLQDRVAQSYGGVVYMDFAELADKQHGRYESLDPALLPELYIAYHDSAAEGSEVVHNDVRERFDRGEQQVIDTLAAIADGAREFRSALDRGDVSRMHALLDRNFDLRAKIFPINRLNRQLIETARAAGASAKFCGSGGAVIGICPAAVYPRLVKGYERIGAGVLRPRIVTRAQYDDQG